MKNERTRERAELLEKIAAIQRAIAANPPKVEPGLNGPRTVYDVGKINKALPEGVTMGKHQDLSMPLPNGGRAAFTVDSLPEMASAVRANYDNRMFGIRRGHTLGKAKTDLWHMLCNDGDQLREVTQAWDNLEQARKSGHGPLIKTMTDQANAIKDHLGSDLWRRIVDGLVADGTIKPHVDPALVARGLDLVRQYRQAVKDKDEDLKHRLQKEGDQIYSLIPFGIAQFNEAIKAGKVQEPAPKLEVVHIEEEPQPEDDMQLSPTERLAVGLAKMVLAELTEDELTDVRAWNAKFLERGTIRNRTRADKYLKMPLVMLHAWEEVFGEPWDDTDKDQCKTFNDAWILARDAGYDPEVIPTFADAHAA